MKIILSDGSVVEVESITLEPHFVIQAADRAAFLNVWDKLTPDNLLKIDIYNKDSFVTSYEFCELVGTQIMFNGDGTLTAHFYLTGSIVPGVDPDYKAAYEMLTGGTV